MCRKTFILIAFVTAIFSTALSAQENIPYDKQLAEKYGLNIPEPNNNLDPAPLWMQNAHMFFGSRKIWKGYDIALKDVEVERIVRFYSGYATKKVHEQSPVVIDGNLDASAIKGVDLISHVYHSPTAFRQAHEQGFRVIPYVHFTDIHTFYADQDVFYFQHPEVIARDANGHYTHTYMDGTDRLYRLLTCANSPSYWKLSLAYIKKMMDYGADGIFIDNVGCSQKVECRAQNFTHSNPEFESVVHEHLFPGASYDYAFDRFLQAVRKLVKSYGKDKIVILNSGLETPFEKDGDCCMWESFIYCGWAWKGRHPEVGTWEHIKKQAKENEWYYNAGRRITALTTLDKKSETVKDDAYWAFSAANLVNFIWWASLDGTGAEVLYQAKMGKPLEPMKEEDNLAHKTYENGLIVLNNSKSDKEIEIPLPPEFKYQKLLDLFDGQKEIAVTNGKVKLTIPADKARVFIAPQTYKKS